MQIEDNEKMVSMHFKGKFPELKQIDLRINRLVVTIMKSKELHDYFFDYSKISLACRYLGIYEPYLRAVNDVADFLDPLYFTEPEKFRQFFQYVLNEIIEGKEPLAIESSKPLRLVNEKELFDGFNLFLRELNILGFDYDYSSHKVIPTVGHTKEESQIETELEEMLDGLDSKYRVILRGAWESFLSHNPDKYRHTTTSLRELTRMIIQQLAPEEKTRKDRIRKIIASEREEEFVESLAETIVKLQDVQSEKVHGIADYDSTLFVLKSTEYLLFFLLKKAGKI